MCSRRQEPRTDLGRSTKNGRHTTLDTHLLRERNDSDGRAHTRCSARVCPTGDGEFLAPPIIIAALSLCLILGGLVLWLPHHWPPLIRTTIFLAALASLVTVCNWTAFAPDVVYESSTSIGPVTFHSDSGIEGRIAFGVAAIAVDVFVLSALVGWARQVRKRVRIRRRRPHDSAACTGVTCAELRCSCAECPSEPPCRAP